MNKSDKGNEKSVEGYLGEKLNFTEYIRIKILIAYTIMKSGVKMEQEQRMPDYEQLMDNLLEIEPAVELKVVINNKNSSGKCCIGCYSTNVPKIDLPMIPFKYSLN